MKDNIEEIYEALKTFSKEPPEELWDNIEERLHPKKKQRGLFWFWGSAAAVLVVFVGYMLTNTSPDNNQPVKKVTNIEHDIDSLTNDTSKDENINTIKQAVTITEEENALPKSSENNKAGIDNLVKQKEKRESLSEHLVEESQDKKGTKTRYDQNYAVVTSEEEKSKSNSNEEQISKKVHTSIMDLTKEEGIADNDSIVKLKEPSLLDISEELIADNKSTKDTLNTRVEGISKWSVEVLGGVSNTASDASIQGASVSTSSQNNFVYTLKVGYALSDRLIIKSGIGNNVLGQEINNIAYVSSDASLFAGDIQNLVSSEEILFVNSPGFASNDGGSETITDVGTLQQQFNYVQIPLEFSYHVLKNQKYTLSLGIGGNVNFLTENRAFLDDEQIGESLGVDTTVFGATLNSNVSYQLTKRMNLFLEPSYNYFQKPINNSNQEFSNTQLRFLFGIRYKL